jgi:hypothetical protein
MPLLKDIEKKTLENIVTDSVTEMRNKDDFEEFEKMEKNHNNPSIDMILTEMIKNRIITIDARTDISSLRDSISTLKDSISNERVENVNTYIEVEKDLYFIKKRIGKWFFGVFLVSNLIAFILGGLANENKRTVYPVIEKSWHIFSSFNKVKGE